MNVAIGCGVGRDVGDGVRRRRRRRRVRARRRRRGVVALRRLGVLLRRTEAIERLHFESMASSSSAVYAAAQQ